jgi:hypothetical protein
MNALHSKASAEWYTPRDYVEAARKVLGGIDLDPASSDTANALIGATRFATRDQDGLAEGCLWRGRVFLNPPGGRVRDFWRRLLREIRSGDTTAAIWIGYSLQQLQTLQAADTSGPVEMANALCFPRKRIAFLNVHGQPSGSPTHGNYVAYFGPKVALFREVFRGFGEVV